MRNRGEELLYQAKSAQKKLGPEDRERIETLRKRVKGALDQKDDRALEDAIADLTQALQAVGRFTDDSASSSEDGAMDASFTSGDAACSVM